MLIVFASSFSSPLTLSLILLLSAAHTCSRPKYLVSLTPPPPQKKNIRTNSVLVGLSGTRLGEARHRRIGLDLGHSVPRRNPNHWPGSRTSLEGQPRRVVILPQGLLQLVRLSP